MHLKKVLSPNGLDSALKTAKESGQKIVLTYGQYDSLHIGHIRHLRQAKSLGDVLVVALGPDPLAKASELPVPEELQAETLAHLDCVDFALLGCDSLAKALELVRPAVYVGRDECENGTSDETGALCEGLGVAYVCAEPVSFGSTLGINRFLSGFSQEVRDYIELFKSRYSLDTVDELLESLSTLKVAVVGDTIIDEYCYCNILGASSKDPILAMQYQDSDTFAGGIVAVANHVANFVSEVGLYTILGDHDSYEDFVRGKLSPTVTPHFMIQAKSPTVRKRRYIEGYTQNKLFEIYFMRDSGLDSEMDAKFRELLKAELPGYDLVIVADFGHGAISPATRDTLIESSRFLAVNAQANSGNRGFHTITKYAKADYVSIAEHEIRLEMRDSRGPARPMIEALAKKLDCGNFVVTRGKRGSLIRNASGQCFEVPAFALRVVDRIGAGDAFLSVTALLAAKLAKPELMCFVGNVVGALAVEILGNQKSIDKASVKKYVASLLA